MRISVWLCLAALCLIASGMSMTIASAPVTEAKSSLLEEKFEGFGKTVKEAENDALRQGCDWLVKKCDLAYPPDSQYLRDNLVQFRDMGTKEFDPPVGVMKVVRMQLSVRPDQQAEMRKQADKHAQQQRMKERQKLSLLVLLGAVGLLAVVGGYLRLEEATKGYCTRLLRVLAATAVLGILSGLLLPLLKRVVSH
jgi:hypothetical protein